MIDEYNKDKTGWARFSDDRVMRYRLARSLRDKLPDGRILNGLELREIDGQVHRVVDDHLMPSIRCTFLMLNPSTADAFQHDPTVGECIKRARSYGADVLEVVNLFAFKSPHPRSLKVRAVGFRGDDHLNDGEILAACIGAHFVVAAWGTDGALDFRSGTVMQSLHRAGVKLHHLGLTKDGFPKHPLARGRHRIPGDFALTEFA